MEGARRRSHAARRRPGIWYRPWACRSGNLVARCGLRGPDYAADQRNPRHVFVYPVPVHETTPRDFINVGRGLLVDEAAMIDCLRDGVIASAALDVFETEPLPASSPLWDLPNVIVSPHMSGDFLDFHQIVADVFIDNFSALSTRRTTDQRGRHGTRLLVTNGGNKGRGGACAPSRSRGTVTLFLIPTEYGGA